MPSIYVREKDPKSHKWRPRRVREGRGIKTGELTGPFYIRPSVNGKQGWRPLQATTFQDAKEEAGHAHDALDAQAKGLTVAEAAALTSNRVTVKSAVEIYLDQKSGKAEKTVAQYKTTLNEFLEALEAINIRFLDQFTNDEAGRNILRSYKKFLENRGYAGKTMDTRINIVNFLLKKNDIKVRLPKDEMPIVEEEAAVPYSEEELEKLFAQTPAELKNAFGSKVTEPPMTPEEFIRYKFFLGTGCRDKEVTFASWQDVDWAKGEYHIRKKLDVGFTPKSHESRSVPLPKSLLKLLKERREKAQDKRWIFVNEEGRPDNHFLRKLKRIAKRAGLNCGQCKTTLTVGRYEKHQVEVSCKDQPVCEHFILHRFRKTCATRWHNQNIPIRTIQKWLGHKSLETTMIYLGVQDSSELRSQVDAAYGD